MASSGGTSAAAKLLSISQPAVSKKLLDLEDQLGKSLVVRKKGKFQLNHHGEELFRKISPHFEELNQAIEFDENSMRGTLEIGVFRWVEPKIFMLRLKEIREKFPNLQISITYMDHNSIEEAVINQKIDIGFCVFVQHRSELISQSFYEQRNTLVGSKEYFKKLGNPSNLKEFKRHSIVAFDHDATAFRVLMKKNELLSHSEKITPDVVFSDPSCALDAVKAGFGIGFCPISEITAELEECNWPQQRIISAGFEIIKLNHKYRRRKIDEAWKILVK